MSTLFDGMTAATEHADRESPNWSARAMSQLLAYAAVHDEFVGEDVVLWARSEGFEEPPDARAWGERVPNRPHPGEDREDRRVSLRQDQQQQPEARLETSMTALSRHVPLPALASIAFQVCQEMGVSSSDLRGQCRGPKVVKARRVVIFLARERTVASYPEIAQYVSAAGSHTTVIEAMRIAEVMYETDDEFRGLVQRVKQAMKVKQ